MHMGLVEPFTIYPRKIKDGRTVFYYRPRDPETGKRLSGVSTGKTSEREAYKYCEALLAAGTLIPDAKPKKAPEEVRRSRRAPTLREYADEQKWWVWGKCAYCIGENLRAKKDKPAIQERQAHDSLRILTQHILPHHGDLIVKDIGPEDLEKLMAAWIAEGFSAKSVNNWASVYRVMLGEAERLRHIKESPWRRVKAYEPDEGGKGTLSREEYLRLMAPATISTVWKGHSLYYAANLLASVTGLRQGEVLALKNEQVHPDHITVAKSWNIKWGEGPQKTKRGTDELPIPAMVYEAIKPFLSWEGYVFSMSGGRRPCTGNRITDALKAAMRSIGITEEERASRGVCFHSWRSFANTWFISQGVPIAKVQGITRHETDKMTDHYTGFRLEDFREVAEAQGSMVQGLMPPEGTQ